MGQTKCKEVLEELLDGRHFSQFTRLVKLLSEYSTPVAAESGQTSKTANNFSFQVESQNLMNQERELLHQNTRLKKGKRLSDELVLHYPAFK